MTALKLYYFLPEHLYIYIFFRTSSTCKRQEDKGEEDRKLPKGHPEQSQKQYKN